MEAQPRPAPERPRTRGSLITARDATNIALTKDEALVLYDWLRRFNERDDTAFEDQAEQRVLWDIEAILEKALEAPLRPDYDILLAAARALVRDEEE